VKEKGAQVFADDIAIKDGQENTRFKIANINDTSSRSIFQDHYPGSRDRIPGLSPRLKMKYLVTGKEGEHYYE
jgi:hypothetical protein